MKRAGYRQAVQWIADNDSGGDDGALDPETVSELVTSCLVADLFGVDSLRVGTDVVRARKRTEKARKRAERTER